MKYNLISALIFGLFIAVLSLYVAWQHNPQCEFHCEGTIYWGAWLTIGLSWFIVGSLSVYGVAWLIQILYRLVRRSGDNS